MDVSVSEMDCITGTHCTTTCQQRRHPGVTPAGPDDGGDFNDVDEYDGSKRRPV